MKQRGLFITFEGCDGGGKTTQSRLLFEWLKHSKIETISTREPGGTLSANQIRSMILDNRIKLDIKSQLLLHFVSRIEHVEDVIKPALSENKVVICDRFFDSTVVYQHYGHKLSKDLMLYMHKELLGNMYPDATFILDIDFNTYKQRMEKKNNNTDRYEALSDDYYKDIIFGFKKIAQDYPKRCDILNSSESTVGETHEMIKQKVSLLLQ